LYSLPEYNESNFLTDCINLHNVLDIPHPVLQVAHKKPARRLVDQRGRRSRTLYRKLNKCECKVLTG